MPDRLPRRGAAREAANVVGGVIVFRRAVRDLGERVRLRQKLGLRHSRREVLALGTAAPHGARPAAAFPSAIQACQRRSGPSAAASSIVPGGPYADPQAPGTPALARSRRATSTPTIATVPARSPWSGSAAMSDHEARPSSPPCIADTRSAGPRPRLRRSLRRVRVGPAALACATRGRAGSAGRPRSRVLRRHSSVAVGLHSRWAATATKY